MMSHPPSDCTVVDLINLVVFYKKCVLDSIVTDDSHFSG